MQIANTPDEMNMIAWIIIGFERITEEKKLSMLLITYSMHACPFNGV